MALPALKVGTSAGHIFRKAQSINITLRESIGSANPHNSGTYPILQSRMLLTNWTGHRP